MPFTIGQRTKYFREQAGMTVAEASELAGISADRLTLIEAEEATPTAGQVLGISWALGIPFDTARGQSEIRDRAVFTRHGTGDATVEDEKAMNGIEEEVLLVAEVAAELRDAGYLTRASA